jgi:hypothetical protein
MHVPHSPSHTRHVMRVLVLFMLAGVLLSACLQLWSWAKHAEGMDEKAIAGPAAEGFRVQLKAGAFADADSAPSPRSREQYRAQLRRSQLKNRSATGTMSKTEAATAGIVSAPSPQRHASSHSEPLPAAPTVQRGEQSIVKQQQQRQQQQQQGEAVSASILSGSRAQASLVGAASVTSTTDHSASPSSSTANSNSNAAATNSV